MLAKVDDSREKCMYFKVNMLEFYLEAFKNSKKYPGEEVSIYY